MNADIEEVREAVMRCHALREQGVSEAVLRGEFQSRLRLMFPDAEDQRWINHYSEGAEARTTIGVGGDTQSSRFIDNLVGSTTIEYESDVRDFTKRNTGYLQVKEHVAGLLRQGAPISHIRGVLSDTVEWIVYNASLHHGVTPETCTPDDVELTELESFQPSAFDDLEAERLALFLMRHLARQRSHPLAARYLVVDLGLESPAYRRTAMALVSLVQAGRATDPATALATELWSRFVDHLEGVDAPFRVGPYVDEVYLNLMARLLSANALNRLAVASDDEELASIVDGSYFYDRYRIDNLVEHDYFGWLARPPHLSELLPIAADIQRDLYAYDFSIPIGEDLFGRLMAQVARRGRRKLLGQEWTPRWLAKLLADRCLGDLPEGQPPEIVDVCCGSGAILAEVLRAARTRYGYSDIDAFHDVVTGFDIDPMAVALAKTTWITVLAGEINAASEPVTIPVYHADSLYSVTPVSVPSSLADLDTVDIDLDGETVALPSPLLRPDYRELFDRLVDWAYDEACDTRAPVPTLPDAAAVVDLVVSATHANLTDDLRNETAEAFLDLAVRMRNLAVAGRNGIWAFILRNTYRPGLLAGQFNGLVSNPPWLAMSALADNPYRDVLTRRASQYGVMPAGQSFLHLELATMHLLHGIDRYLRPGAAIACLVPGTVLNGYHHERLRQREYLHCERPVPFALSDVWQVAPGTFKYPGAALIGRRMDSPSDADYPPSAGAIAAPDGLAYADFARREIGSSRTAWTLESAGLPAFHAGSGPVSQQGADIMPRTAVCLEILDESGTEYRVDTPERGTEWGFTVKQAKQLTGSRFRGYVAPRFIHRLALSENLLPFVFGPHQPPVAIPATRDAYGAWRIYEPHEIRNMGFTRTARRFAAINNRLATAGAGHPLESRIDVRRKLTNQRFGSTGSLVIAGAGGKFICAACVAIPDALDLIIDQTLYWQVVADDNHAWFTTGMLNSTALTEAVLPFNPRGDFGPRHIHALPYRLMPAYDPDDSDHTAVAAYARQLSAVAATESLEDAYLADPRNALAIRRRRLRTLLTNTDAFRDLDRLCSALLGTGPPISS